MDDLLREVAIRVLRSAETTRADVPPFRCERQFYAAALAVVNHTSKSAWLFLREGLHERFIHMLVELGANPRYLTDDGGSPLSTKCRMGKHPVVFLDVELD